MKRPMIDVKKLNYGRIKSAVDTGEILTYKLACVKYKESFVDFRKYMQEVFSIDIDRADVEFMTKLIKDKDKFIRLIATNDNLKTNGVTIKNLVRFYNYAIDNNIDLNTKEGKRELRNKFNKEEDKFILSLIPYYSLTFSNKR